MKEGYLVTGIKYEVSLKNEENKNYSGIRYVIINSTDIENGYVSGINDCGKETDRLFTGSLNDCKSFVKLIFSVKYNDYALRNKLYEDFRVLRESDDPKYRDISDRLEIVLEDYHPLDCEYYLRSILNDFHADTQYLDLNDVSDEDTLDDMIEAYEKLIERQVSVRFGHVMFTESFKSSVEDGCFTDDDGEGNYLTEDGLEGPSIDFYNLESENWTKYPYVVWYNK